MVRRLILALISGCLTLGSWQAARCADPPPPQVGAVVGDFTAVNALNIQGLPISLSQVGRDRIVVVAFLRTDCPLAKLYAPRLAELARAYAPKGVVFFGVDSNPLETMNAVVAFVRTSRIEFPILRNTGQEIADALGATRTPQVVVLDRERKIRYRGRIDDQFGFVPQNRAVSYHKTAPQQNDLKRALDELLAGKAVSVAETDAVGCLIGRYRQSADPSDSAATDTSLVTYAKDVAPILNRRCVSCHRPKQIAPFGLATYDDAARRADMIAEVTQLGRMPPWHADPKYGSFHNDARLTDKEKRILARWAATGAPPGDLKDLPEPPKFAEGWIIPQPDEILYMSPKPFDVPATGVVPYQNFIIDPGWKEDRWISAIEGRPGNPSVVHHILFYIVPPDGSHVKFLRPDDTFLGTYAPGMQPEVLPEGFARPVPAGSKFLFSVHYTPNGTPQKDLSYMGIKFADPASVVREVTMSSAFNKQFRIPAGAANHPVEAEYLFEEDSLLLSLIPHMHYRGKDFVFEAHYPNGDVETLLSVPHYDFAWQTVYRLNEHKLMPRGTVIRCLAHYDNSAGNLNNPDPKADVAWGEQTFDEMMIGFLEVAPAATGLVHHTSWWTLLAERLPLEKIAAIALSVVNVALIGTLIFGTARFRKRKSLLPAPAPSPAIPELPRGDR